jgi:hypothetical protein
MIQALLLAIATSILIFLLTATIGCWMFGRNPVEVLRSMKFSDLDWAFWFFMLQSIIGLTFLFYKCL